MEIPINYKTTLKLCIINMNFKRRKEKREVKESVVDDKSCHERPYVPPKKEEDVISLSMTWQKGDFDR